MFSKDATERESDALVTSDQSARAADRARVASLASRIWDLQRTLRKKRLNSYKYPVLTLPNEIVSEIFLHFVPAYPLAPPLSGLFSPTVLTQICHQWRNIAHAIPALWRAVSLSFTEPFQCDDEDNILLHSWMSRSRSYPISFSVNGKGVAYDDPTQCMATLSSHRVRWEYLELSHIPESFLPFLCDPMPFLRHLDVSYRDDYSTVTLGDAPLLRSVKIIDYLEPIILPWRQLTSLVLLSVFPYACTEVLQQTTLLVHCELSLYKSYYDDDDNIDTELPFLQSLIMVKEASLRTPYLHSLILPALHTLQIPDSDLGDDPIAGLTFFVSKSRCVLRELRITGTESAAVATEYQTAFPTILQLSLHKYSESHAGLVSGRITVLKDIAAPGSAPNCVIESCRSGNSPHRRLDCAPVVYVSTLYLC
ncbi:hypothetical protein C8R43DRAFT_986351 [Mycena crocata]|nr:hypothetical protein C8R43DRAFT_986351 [Mycena crocata]